MAKFSEAFKKYDPKSQAKWYDWEGVEILIAPIRNPYQQKYMTKHFTNAQLVEIDEHGFGGAFKEDVLEVALQKMHEVNAHTLTLDWRNITDEEDRVVPFSHEKIKELMYEDNKFGTWVQNKATELFIERLTDQAEKVKN